MNGIKRCRNRLCLKGKFMNYKDNTEKEKLKESLLKLDKKQLKLFYGILVHYWTKNRYFISERNFFNLWCELNKLCGEVDEGFPDPYDRELIKSYCIAHPYYFIDILETVIVIKLFCEYFSNRIGILTMIVNKLATEGLWAAYECSNKALGLSENIAELVADSEKHLKAFSHIK